MGQQTHLPPRSRKWVIEAAPIVADTGEGEQIVGYEELETEEILQALTEAANIVHRVGGVVMIGSHRQEQPAGAWAVPVEGVYATTALVVKWEAYSPAAAAPAPANGQPAAEPAAATG